MNHTVCWITGIAAAILIVASAALIATGALMKPGQPAVLTVVLIGMLCGVAAAAFGAISLMTYQTPAERRHWKAMDEIAKSTLPAANQVVAQRLSDGLK